MYVYVYTYFITALATLKPQAGITAAPGALAVPQPAYGAEAGAERAEEPMEEAGMSEEIMKKVRHSSVTSICVVLFT